jgi:hypothetical protein
VQDEIVAPDLDRLRGQLLHRFLRPARRVLHEVGVEHVLVAEPHRLHVGGLPRLEVAALGVHRRDTIPGFVRMTSAR